MVSQLEQDRQVVSNKVRRLQSELESLGTERDVAVKVAVELKAKFKALKESSKKDMSNLQSRLHQVSLSLELLYIEVNRYPNNLIHVHACTCTYLHPQHNVMLHYIRCARTHRKQPVSMTN